MLEAEGAGGAFGVEEVARNSADALAAAMGDEGDLVRLRLERGCRCFALLEGQVVGYGWVSTEAEWIGELELEIRPPAGEAYVWNCVTLPAHRFRGCFRALLRHITATARAEGVPRLWIGSVDGGAESAVLGAGFRPVLRFSFASLFGLSWLSLRGAPGADPRTVGEALESLGTGGGPPRAGLRRTTRRRH
jgi:GNAT superfamily N-acetyltransferase